MPVQVRLHIGIETHHYRAIKNPVALVGNLCCPAKTGYPAKQIIKRNRAKERPTMHTTRLARLKAVRALLRFCRKSPHRSAHPQMVMV